MPITEPIVLVEWVIHSKGCNKYYLTGKDEHGDFWESSEIQSIGKTLAAITVFTGTNENTVEWSLL